MLIDLKMTGESNNNNRVLEPTHDPNTVYYIYPADNNNYKFIYEVFNGEGYSYWKRSMIFGLFSKNKM